MNTSALRKIAMECWTQKHIYFSLRKNHTEPGLFRLLTQFYHSNRSLQHLEFLESEFSYTTVRTSKAHVDTVNTQLSYLWTDICLTASLLQWSHALGLIKIGVCGWKFRLHACSKPLRFQLWTNLNRQHKGNLTRPRREWRGFRRGEHAALADARYDHSRSFMDEGAELCRMKFKCFHYVRCLQSLPSQHPIRQTHSTCFPRDDTKQKPTSSFTTKNTRGKRNHPTWNIKKRYTDKRNAEKKTLRSDYIYAMGVKNSSVIWCYRTWF